MQLVPQDQNMYTRIREPFRFETCLWKW